MELDSSTARLPRALLTLPSPSTFGQVKRVTIPKKADGRSRGFAFVEFLTKQEAKSALEALAHTHLYGRHLVLDYAAQDDKSVEELREKAQKAQQPKRRNP
jgi:multiple RNA-binding domain-containing protein 1